MSEPANVLLLVVLLTVRVLVVAPDWVMKPVPLMRSTVSSKLFRSQPAPALTEMPLLSGMTAAAPFFRMPPVTATFWPLKLLVALESTKVPAPALVSAVPVAVLVMAPLMVLVLAGLSTVMVRSVAPRFIAPERITPLPATGPAKAKLPLTVVGLRIVRTVPSLSSEVPPAMVRVPVPTGPLVMTGEPVLPAPNMRPPWFRLNPVVKVLAPLRARTPVPVLLSEVMPAF